MSENTSEELLHDEPMAAEVDEPEVTTATDADEATSGDGDDAASGEDWLEEPALGDAHPEGEATAAG